MRKFAICASALLSAAVAAQDFPAKPIRFVTSAVGGHIALMFPSTVIAVPHVKSGRLRALGFTGLHRSRVLPDIQTLDEAGLKGFDITGWYGLFAPACTPRQIINQLQTNVAAVVNDPHSLPTLESWGLTPVGTTPEQFAAFIKIETEKYARIARAANIPKT